MTLIPSSLSALKSLDEIPITPDIPAPSTFIIAMERITENAFTGHLLSRALVMPVIKVPLLG